MSEFPFPRPNDQVLISILRSIEEGILKHEKLSVTPSWRDLRVPLYRLVVDR